MQIELLETVRLSTQSLRIMAAGLRENGIDPAPLLREAGIDPLILDDPQAEIQASQEVAFQRLFIASTRQIDGVWMRTGMRYRVMSYGPLGMAVLAAANVTESLQVLGGFQALTFSLMHYWAELEDGVAVALCADDTRAPEELKEFQQERALGSVTMFLNDLQPPVFPLAYIETVLDRPAGWQDCERLLGVPVVFGAGRTRWVFKKGSGNLTLPMASPLLEETYRDLCAKLVQTTSGPDAFVRRVSDHLVRSGRGFPTAIDAARQLGVSERTLHRKLKAHATSFRELLEEIRKARALELLEKSTLSIERIAEMLGYAETASFTRAFSRWRGQSPRRYRQACQR